MAAEIKARMGPVSGPADGRQPGGQTISPGQTTSISQKSSQCC
jgi:hypothetical protein